MKVITQDGNYRYYTDKMSDLRIRRDGRKYTVDTHYSVGGVDVPYPIGSYPTEHAAEAAIWALREALSAGQKSFVMPQYVGEVNG